MKDTAKILKGIAAYKAQQAEIIAAIKRHTPGMTQDQFDNEFGDMIRREATREEYKKHGCRWQMEMREPKIWSLDKDAFILGDFSGGQWSKYLELMQLMVAAGIISQRGKKPNIVYFLP